jgi:hypothetical protein
LPVVHLDFDRFQQFTGRYHREKIVSKFFKDCFRTLKLTTDHTVSKLQSLNLHFSSMFFIERKVVHVGEEKIITLYFYQVSVKFEDFSFTFNDAEDYARGEINPIHPKVN